MITEKSIYLTCIDQSKIYYANYSSEKLKKGGYYIVLSKGRQPTMSVLL